LLREPKADHRSPAMRAQLLPLDGGPPIDITRDVTVVGRKEECDLRLDHKSVSKVHCVLVKTDGLLLLRDLGSTNGTRVNGQQIRRAALLPNDQLSIASYRFRVYLGPDAVQAAPPGEEYTEHLSAEEVADLAQRAKSQEDSDEDHGAVFPQRNDHPDVYPPDGPNL
jgi:pSer/pThr/pTyr-binding forkhead associated (FHA) protein